MSARSAVSTRNENIWLHPAGLLLNCANDNDDDYDDDLENQKSRNSTMPRLTIVQDQTKRNRKKLNP